MLPVINLGPLSLPLPEFSLLIGFVAGSALAERNSKRIWKDSAFLEKLLWTSLLAGLIGARISFFVRNPSAFSGNYLSLISINPNLLDLPGGYLIAAVASIYLISRSETPLLIILDCLTPFLGLMAGAVHISHFASGTGFGSPTELPWGIFLWGEVRHPVQLYYLLGSILVLVLVLFLLSKDTYAQGFIFFRFSLLTGLYLLFLSRFQENGIVFPGGFRVDQIFYWLCILISLTFLNYYLLPKELENSHDDRR